MYKIIQQFVFFSLQATEIFLENNQTFMVGLFLQKTLQAKSCSLLFQKSSTSSTIDFWLGFKYGSWQYCQKNCHLKQYFPSHVILLVSLFSTFYTSEKKVLVTERNKRLSLQILFINWGTQPVYNFC